jgi:hypothetical protein
MPVSLCHARLLAVAAAGSVIALSAIVAPTIVSGQPAPGGPPAAGPAGAPPAGGTAAPASVGTAMTAMNRLFGARGLRGQISDATKNASSLTMIADFQREAIISKMAVPPTINALPEADRPARMAEYKKEMNKLIRQALDAEEALLANDNAKAAEILTAMNATQTEGHQQFRARGRGGPARGPGGPGAGGPPAGGAPAAPPAQ